MSERLIIDRLLDSVAFTAPVQLADVMALRAAIADTPGLEVFHTRTEVHVVIYRGGEVWYKRDLPVREQESLPER